MYEKVITIYPVILDDQSNFVEQSCKLFQNTANSKFGQRLHAMLAQILKNLLSKYYWHKDCFNSVNLEAINYIFNVLTSMPAVMLTMVVQKRSVLFIFGSQGAAQ